MMLCRNFVNGKVHTCTYVRTYVPLVTADATETVLREAMQALVRVQIHMLARVVEIRSADLAVELEP